MKVLTFLIACFVSTSFLFAQGAEEKNEIAIKVKGMVCGACEEKVEKHLNKVEGIEKAKASYKEGEVRIILATDEVIRTSIEQAVKESGFEVVKEEKDKKKKREKTKEKETAFILKVSGMMCGACENAVKKAVKEVNGVESVEASHTSGEVSVEFDAETATKKQIVEAINQTRFKVVSEKE